MDLEFEWDAAKGEANLRKHGVAFDEAITAFFDPVARIFDDPIIRLRSGAKSSLAIRRSLDSCSWALRNVLAR